MKIQKAKPVIQLKNKDDNIILEADFNREPIFRVSLQSIYISEEELKELPEKIKEFIIIYQNEQ